MSTNVPSELTSRRLSTSERYKHKCDVCDYRCDIGNVQSCGERSVQSLSTTYVGEYVQSTSTCVTGDTSNHCPVSVHLYLVTLGLGMLLTPAMYVSMTFVNGLARSHYERLFQHTPLEKMCEHSHILVSSITFVASLWSLAPSASLIPNTGQENSQATTRTAAIVLLVRQFHSWKLRIIF